MSGPTAGKIRRYDDARRALFTEFEEILAWDQCSEEEAARRLGAYLPGGDRTSLDGKIKGFLRLWREERRDGRAIVPSIADQPVEEIIKQAVEQEVKRVIDQGIDGGYY